MPVPPAAVATPPAHGNAPTKKTAVVMRQLSLEMKPMQQGANARAQTLGMELIVPLVQQVSTSQMIVELASLVEDIIPGV